MQSVVKPLKNYYNLAEVSPKAQPFYIKNKLQSDTLVLLVHGFTSSPYGLHHLADTLAGYGYDIEAVLLAGHGASFDDLKKSKYLDWYQSLESVFLRNVNNYKNIFLIGDSFGANLAVHLAYHYPQVSGIITLNAGIFLKKEKPIRLALPFARLFLKKYKKSWQHFADPHNAKETGRHINIPVPSIVEFYRFIDRFTKREFDQVNVPILIIHSHNDSVSHARSSEWLYQHWASQDKQVFILQKNKHGFNFINNSRHDFILNKISNFISQHR